MPVLPIVSQNMVRVGAYDLVAFDDFDGETVTINDELVCADYAEQVAFQCSECGDWFYLTDLGDFDDVCESCSRELTTCDDCGARCDCNGPNNADGRTVCEDCACHYYTCESCGCIVHSDDSNCNESGCVLCNECYDNECNYCDDYNDGDTWETRGWHCADNTYDSVPNGYTYGVELETANCNGYTNRDWGSWGVHSDGSISGMEFVSPVLSGDKGLDDIKDKLERTGFTVNADCGYHLHVGVKHLTPKQRMAIVRALAASEDVWFSLVSRSRQHNTYCSRLPNRDDSHIRKDSWDNIVEYAYDRYFWLNVRAFNRHGTIEIRLHQGTVDSVKVINWVKAVIRFMDAVKDMPIERIESKAWDMRAVSETWDSAELSSYYYSRQAHFA